MIACHGWSQPQGKALNPHGELYTAVNVVERHAMRNMIDEMRGAGQVIRGPSGLTARNRQEFANQLDRWLARGKKAVQLKGAGPGATELSAEEYPPFRVAASGLLEARRWFGPKRLSNGRLRHGIVLGAQPSGKLEHVGHWRRT